MEIKFDGFDELQKEFEDMANKAEKLDGEHDIPLEVLFDDSFMQKYTSCSNLSDFFKNGGFNIETQEDFDKISNEELSRYVNKITSFDD